MVNSAAICQMIVPGANTHAAIVFLDRDQGVLGRRLGRAPRHDDGVWRRLDHRGRAQGYRRRGRRRALDTGAREFAGLARLRHRRHPDGPHRRPRRHALDRDLWRADDRPWPRDLDARSALAAVDRAWAVHRPDRARRHQCAPVHLCQPLVRPQARLGAGADFERQLSRRRGVAAGVRARHRRLWLAADHALVCARRDRRHRAAGRDLFSAPARRDSSPRPRPAPASATRACSACRATSCSR